MAVEIDDLERVLQFGEVRGGLLEENFIYVGA